MNEHIFFLQQQFRDFDLFCESTRNWDLDYRQLDAGKFFGELLMFGDTTTLFTRAKTGRHLLQKGSSPTGLITFGLLADADISMSWRNLDIDGNQMFIFPPDGELHGITHSDFDVYTLSFSEKTLDQTCHALELPDFKKLIGCNESFICNPAHISQLRKRFQKFELDLVNCVSEANNSIHLQQLEEELCRYLIATLAESTAFIPKPIIRKRDRALKLAVNYIEESDMRISSVRKLCSISNVSERTLEYAFYERYKLSPKSFIKTHHLNKVRKTLRQADPCAAKIHAIAGRQGFWHMSQFAADYKRLFRELPSETLRKT